LPCSDKAGHSIHASDCSTLSIAHKSLADILYQVLDAQGHERAAFWVMLMATTFAVFKVGYHVELASGGHYSPAALHARVAEIQGKISPGIGLTLNLLYISPH